VTTVATPTERSARDEREREEPMTTDTCTADAPCDRHRAEALAAAKAAAKAYEAANTHRPAKDVARDSQGVSQYAYQHTFERLETPCSKTTPRTGW
jgi:hypothetical protein